MKPSDADLEQYANWSAKALDTERDALRYLALQPGVAAAAAAAAGGLAGAVQTEAAAAAAADAVAEGLWRMRDLSSSLETWVDCSASGRGDDSMEGVQVGVSLLQAQHILL